MNHLRPASSGRLALVAAAVLLGARDAGAEDVVLPGRVVVRESGRPVVGAIVEVERKGGGGAAVERLTTDADGRFRLRLDPSSDASASRPAVRVRHPDFVALKGGGVTLTDLIGRARRGEPTFLDPIRLDAGVEYTGVIIRPDGSPAAGQEVQFQNWGWTYYPRQHNFAAESTTRTGADGRFRLRMWKTKALEINVTPDDLAPFRRFIGHAGRGDERPDYWVPADLGRFVLEDGSRTVVTGRLLDRAGRPIAGERLQIQGRIDLQLTRKTTTGADGSLAFPPVHPGSFNVMGERQGHGAYISHDLPAQPPPPRPIGPVKVVVKVGGAAGAGQSWR